MGAILQIQHHHVGPTDGSGLGLSIVKEILTLHKANYGVNSKLGKGSTFWFEMDTVKLKKIRILPAAVIIALVSSIFPML